MRRDPQEEFSAEISTLRDQLVDAVVQRRQSTLEAGLKIFEELAQSLLRRTALIDEVMQGDRLPSMTRQLLGPVGTPGIGAIGDALWPVIEQGFRSEQLDSRRE